MGSQPNPESPDKVFFSLDSSSRGSPHRVLARCEVADVEHFEKSKMAAKITLKTFYWSDLVQNHTNMFLSSQGIRKCILLPMSEIWFWSYSQKCKRSYQRSRNWPYGSPNFQNYPIVFKLVSNCSSCKSVYTK